MKELYTLEMDTKDLIAELRKLEMQASLSKKTRQTCSKAASRLAILDYSARQMYKQIEKLKAGEKDG